MAMSRFVRAHGPTDSIMATADSDKTGELPYLPLLPSASRILASNHLHHPCGLETVSITPV
jgi:hypothetical protein